MVWMGTVDHKVGWVASGQVINLSDRIAQWLTGWQVTICF
jgi:hypothetical protein